MRVLLVGPAPPQLCGVSSHVDGLARSLHGRGHKVGVMTYGELGDELAPHYHLHRLRTVGRPDERRLVRGASFLVSGLASRLSEYDLVHAHTSVPAGITGALVSKRMRVPFVYTAHNDLAGRGRRSWRRVAQAWVQGQAHVRTSVVPQSGFKWIPNAIRADLLQPARCSTDRLSIRLLFVGHLNETKGLGDLLQACSRLQEPGWELDVLGGGVPGSLEHYQRRCFQLGISDRVRFHGIVPSHKFYEVADALIVPGRSEGLPTALLEGMAYALPIVATSVGAIPDVLGDSYEGLVPPGAVSQLASAIDKLCKDELLRTRMAEFSRARVDQYTWESVVNHYLELYEEVL